MRPADTLRRPKLFGVAASLAMALLSLIGAQSNLANAAPALRYQVAQRGDMVLFGNTLGYDCRASVPKPVVGSVDISMCGTNTDDIDIDVLWSSDMPAAGGATAGTSVMPNQARSTSVLTLPTGALVTYARLYWSAEGSKGAITPGATVLLERPGIFMKNVVADSSAQVDLTGIVGTHYQQSADITDLVQSYGPGAYRLSNVMITNPANQADQLLYAAWSVVVFYRQASQPPRNLTVFDGFDEVAGTATVNATLNNFLVPNTGYDAKLGVVGYEGNFDATGDRIAVNGTQLTDTQNPATNFFNGTHSVLGQPVTTTGDLPQMSGVAGSMNGIDIDVVDITPRVKAGDKSIDILASTTNDAYFIGVIAGSVASLQPIFSDSQLDGTDLTNPGGAVRPGDKIQLNITLPNTGTDTAVGSFVTVTLPPGVTYVPGTITVGNGPNAGPKTDGPGDDQAEYDPATRTVKIRFGTGATGSKGGTVTTSDTPPTVSFQVTVDPSANGMDIKLTGVITAQGMVGSMQGIPPASWNTGSILTPLDGPGKGTPIFVPNRPLTIPVRECATNLDCPTSKPRCDTTMFRCTNGCMVDADCAGLGVGQVCTAAKVCGCNTDGNCLSNSCDTSAHQCRIPNTDLTVTVTTQPNPPQPNAPVTHIITVTNNGPDPAPPGVTVIYTVPPGGTIKEITPGDGWQCKQAGRTITCTYSGTIPPNSSPPKIRIVVVPDPGKTTIDVNTTVKTPGSNDPNPSNNSVVRTDTLGGDPLPEEQLAGGGCSCDMRGNATSQAQGAAMLSLLAMAGLFMFRRRRHGAER